MADSDDEIEIPPITWREVKDKVRDVVYSPGSTIIDDLKALKPTGKDLVEGIAATEVILTCIPSLTEEEFEVIRKHFFTFKKELNLGLFIQLLGIAPPKDHGEHF